MLYYKAEKICLRDHLTNDVVSCCSQQWDCKKSELRLYVPSVCSKLTDSLCCAVCGCCSLPCVCVPFWELRSRPWQNTFLPCLVPAQDIPPPTKGEFCVCSGMCVCVWVLCLAKCLVARVFSGCFRAHSASTACVLSCVRTRSAMGHDSKEHTVLNSTEGPRDKYNSALCFFRCHSPLQLFQNLFSLGFYLHLILLLFTLAECVSACRLISARGGMISTSLTLIFYMSPSSVSE